MNKIHYHILDNDLSKFMVSYAYKKMYPEAECTFKLVDHNHVKRTKVFLNRYKDALKKLKTADSIGIYSGDWLKEKIPYIPTEYWEWLRDFRFEPERVNAYLDEDGILNVEITDKCYKATLYEVPCLYIINEVLNRNQDTNNLMSAVALIENISFASRYSLQFVDFGTSRRFTQFMHENAIFTLKSHSSTFLGTSNLHFACKYDIDPVGICPREWFKFHESMYGHTKGNHMAVVNWINTYEDDLCAVPIDAYGTDSLPLKYGKLFDRVIQDCENPYEFGDKVLKLCEEKEINPKHVVFNHHLEFSRGAVIKNKYKDHFDVLCCLDTALTNTVFDAKDGERYLVENLSMCMSKYRIGDIEEWHKIM